VPVTCTLIGVVRVIGRAWEAETRLVAGYTATAVMSVGALEDGGRDALIGVLTDSGTGQIEVAPHLVALIRAGARFGNGKLAERPGESGDEAQVA
jgi:hypothetical protein